MESYEGTILFLLELGIQKMKRCVDKLTNLTNFPHHFYVDKKTKAPDETRLKDFMKEYYLSFDELDDFVLSYYTFSSLKRVLLNDYLSPDRTKTTNPRIDPFLLPAEGLDYPKGQFTT